MSFNSTQPFPGLVHLDFDSFCNLGKALVRPQEFAESPKFKDKVFTTSRLKKYITHCSPYVAYAGFNIPGSYVDEFFAKFPAITKAELEIYHHLNSLNLPERYYVIGSADKAAKKPSWKAGDHETAHGLWYLDEEYREEQRSHLEAMPPKLLKHVREVLLSWSIYAPAVIEDECHAYLGTDSLSRLTSRFNWTTLPDEVVEVHDKLETTLFKKLGRV